MNPTANHNNQFAIISPPAIAAELNGIINMSLILGAHEDKGGDGSTR